jgi:hypothetical protein
MKTYMAIYDILFDSYDTHSPLATLSCIKLVALGPVASMISSAPPNGCQLWLAVILMISFGLWVPGKPTNLSVFFSKQMVNSPEVSEHKMPAVKVRWKVSADRRLRHVEFVQRVECTRKISHDKPRLKGRDTPSLPPNPQSFEAVDRGLKATYCW